MSNDEKKLSRQWFRSAKFAVLFHWGLYSLAAGTWKGKRIHGIGEWIMYRGRIPVREYETLAAQFNPVKFSGKEWARIAKAAGMKYIVVTAKHHDGFAMFKSKASQYNIVDATPYKRDPLLELAEACEKEGIRLGFYYSQFQDWHEPDGAGNTWDFPQERKFENYFNAKALPQVRELLTNYGPVALIWFDTPGTMSREDSLRLVQAVHELQPDCLINSRIGNGVGDYDSLGDQEIPLVARGGLWESVDTHNDTWGYVEFDRNWKSPRELVERMVKVVGKGGNYMLNVGPTGLGQIPAACAGILREVGAWVGRNKEALYATDASPLGLLPWGECTSRSGKLYLHVLDWPQSERLVVPGVTAKVKRAVLLTDARRRPLRVSVGKGAVSIRVPRVAPDSPATVVALDVAGKLRGCAARTVINCHRNDFDPPYSVLKNCKHAKFSWMEKFGDWKHADCVAEWSGPESKAAWRFTALEPARYYLELDYSCDERSSDSEGMLTVGRTSLPFPVLDTGERSNPVPDHGLWPLFRVYRLGMIELPRAGNYSLTIGPMQKTEGGWIKLRRVSLLPVNA